MMILIFFEFKKRYKHTGIANYASVDNLCTTDNFRVIPGQENWLEKPTFRF